MNKVVLMGRLTRDPEIRYSQGEKATAVARFSLAVQRRFKREDGVDVDFINCVAFGRQAEFAEKYFRQGMRICISGRIQTGSYVNRDGIKVYTTDIVIEEQDFCESKKASYQAAPDTGQADGAAYQQAPSYSRPTPSAASGDGFMTIPDGLEDELPFS